jgi:hypothetical protein
MTDTANPRYEAAIARARATNHKDLLEGVDGRSAIARRFRDLVLEIMGDQGGPDNCAQARIQLIRRFAAASVIAEGLEAAYVNGQQIDITTHTQLCSSLVRIAHRIGINRRLRNVTPALADYLEAANAATEQNAKSTEANTDATSFETVSVLPETEHAWDDPDDPAEEDED